MSSNFSPPTTDTTNAGSPPATHPNGSVASPLFISKPQRQMSDLDITRNGKEQPDASPLSYPKSKIKVLLLEKVHKLAIAEFEKEGFQLHIADKLSEEELMEKIKDAHAIGVRSRTKLTKPVLQAARKLLAIGCFW